MQRFMAQLSRPLDKIEFEKSWHSHPGWQSQPQVEFAFAGSMVSALVHTDDAAKWPSAGFHQTFSAAVRRLDGTCNIRWL